MHQLKPSRPVPKNVVRPWNGDVRQQWKKKKQAEEAAVAAFWAEKAAAEAETAVLEERDLEPSTEDDETDASDIERGGQCNDRSGYSAWDPSESEEEDVESEDDYVMQGSRGGVKAKKQNVRKKRKRNTE